MDSRKPLTAGEIEELKALLEAEKYSLPLEMRCDYARAVPYGYDGCDLEVDNTMHALICGAVNALPRLLSLLTPPPDAAVRDAIKRAEADIATCNRKNCQQCKDARTIIRAAQAPRLTGEQREAVKEAKEVFAISGDVKLANRLEAVFPEAFAGEVGRG